MSKSEKRTEYPEDRGFGGIERDSIEQGGRGEGAYKKRTDSLRIDTDRPRRASSTSPFASDVPR
ncbi:MAG: hypothetical protein D6812_03775 [Deltaproteobacteria bacterium]|nr:MAG: hypothetical protein D6812_03775 [Deltaproteobacteria bacterium]